MVETAVDRIYEEYRDAVAALQSSGELSLSTAMDSNARKALLLAAASYFENRISDDVLEYCKETVGANKLVPAFVKNKAISRQYHTWFQWDGNTATSFFALFGVDFKDHMRDLIKGDDQLRISIANFLSVGNDRNRLVHGDYATFALEKTADEIYSQYQSARLFINCIRDQLRRCAESAENDSAKSDF